MNAIKEKMIQWLKNRGATNASTNEKANEILTEEDYNKLLAGMQVLRNIAWHHAIEYRFDPILSQAHEEYLNLANDILKEYD